MKRGGQEIKKDPIQLQIDLWKKSESHPLKKCSGCTPHSVKQKRTKMNTNRKIQIENPCPANWKNMVPDKDGRFCRQCSKVVIDFSEKTLKEINVYLTDMKGEPVCGRYQERHTTTSNTWFTVLNSFETVLSKIKLQRLSIFLITGMLILTGCHRRLQGAYVSYSSKKNKHKHTDKMQQDQVHLKTNKLKEG